MPGNPEKTCKGSMEAPHVDWQCAPINRPKHKATFIYWGSGMYETKSVVFYYDKECSPDKFAKNLTFHQGQGVQDCFWQTAEDGRAWTGVRSPYYQ